MTMTLTTRSRWNLFKQYRSQYQTRRSGSKEHDFSDSDSSTQRLASADKHEIVIPMPPRWLDQIEEVKFRFSTLEKNMKTLEQLHQSHLLPGFDDRKDEEQAIEILTSETTRIFHEAQVVIKKLSGVPVSEEEEKMRKNAQVSLATKLQELSTKFRKDQSVYLQALRRRSEIGYLNKEKPRNMDFFAEEQELDNYNKGFNDQQLQTVERESEMIQSRNRELQQLNQSIVELSEVMKEMAILVIDQGTIVDRIDYNIEQSAEKIESGLKELVSAKESQEGTRSRICIMILCVMILAVVFIIILRKII